MTGTIDPAALSAAQRTALEEWRTQLKKLLVRRKATRWRGEANGNLRTYLRSSIEGAYVAIAEAGFGLVSNLTGRATETMRPYFTSEGEARAYAQKVPALVDLKLALMGPEPAETIAELDHQAREAIDLLEAILDGREIWSFQEIAPAK